MPSRRPFEADSHAPSQACESKDERRVTEVRFDRPDDCGREVVLELASALRVRIAYPVGSREFFDWHHQVRQADEGRYAGHLYEFDGHKGERLLDVGCGIGWLVWQFARGGADITGVDLSDNSLALARKRLEYDRLKAELVKGNAQDLPFPDGSFDFVTSAGVLHHTPRRKARSMKSIACCGPADGL